MEEKKRVMKTVDDSRTEQVHLIMHQHLNAGGRLFGGMLMQWVDEVSGVVAMRLMWATLPWRWKSILTWSVQMECATW